LSLTRTVMAKAIISTLMMTLVKIEFEMGSCPTWNRVSAEIEICGPVVIGGRFLNLVVLY